MSRMPHQQTIAPYNTPNMYELRSAFGFRTIPPISRQDRRVQGDRDAREKCALAERRAGFERHEGNANPLESLAHSAGFMANEERFHTDVAGELKNANNARLTRGLQNTEVRRRAQTDREDRRWQEADDALTAETQRTQELAGTSKRNVGGSGYNIVNHDWRHGHDAEMAKFNEDASVWRGANRANALQKATHPEGYNFVTGQPQDLQRPVPPRPAPPQPAQRNQYLP